MAQVNTGRLMRNGPIPSALVGRLFFGLRDRQGGPRDSRDLARHVEPSRHQKVAVRKSLRDDEAAALTLPGTISRIPARLDFGSIVDIGFLPAAQHDFRQDDDHATALVHEEPSFRVGPRQHLRVMGRATSTG